jgi:hypothetical protein
MGGYNRQFSSFPNTMYKFGLNPLGIGQEEQVVKALNFEFYPNPNSGEELFWKSNNEIDRIEIIAAQGKFIRSPKTLRNSLMVSDLAPGFYQLRIYREGEMLAQKKLIRN